MSYIHFMMVFQGNLKRGENEGRAVMRNHAMALRHRSDYDQIEREGKVCACLSVCLLMWVCKGTLIFSGNVVSAGLLSDVNPGVCKSWRELGWLGELSWAHMSRVFVPSALNTIEHWHTVCTPWGYVCVHETRWGLCLLVPLGFYVWVAHTSILYISNQSANPLLTKSVA